MHTCRQFHTTAPCTCNLSKLLSRWRKKSKLRLIEISISRTCLDTSSPCTFPHAHVSLTKKQQLLMVGQSYRVIVQIEMPESPQNLDLGMFMVCGEMRDIESMLRGHSCRSAMMRYRSPLIRMISTWALSPLYVFGFREEFQRVSVEIFSNYLEQKHHPITDVYVELQSQKIQFYTVSLHIVADFTGKFMRHYVFIFYYWYYTSLRFCTCQERSYWESKAIVGFDC